MPRGRRALTLAYSSRLPMRSILIGAMLTQEPPKDSTVRLQAIFLGIPCIALFLLLGWSLNNYIYYGLSAFSTLMFFLTRKKGL